ncbi:DUF3937 family protein [Bacillus tropicus]|uniref:DUF3937 family protein n=1 Tax=Bacillus shihchuchen TaxID=3036942 RepID=A0ABT7KU21_9BACI|nr:MULTISPECIES: DUF3937 family protein [Bacillus]MDL2416914.1 DUF3937 family protein [Bacillus shihchuchen]OTX75530.1 hypothetical protein BK728_28435 [Bacillus thuringiensis serovar chanpaisis]PNK23785.1 hypothetical protein CBR56_25745 [Bacillus thuringiensis]HDR3651391.1 DUF3937 family protein [Bacillus anthracis]MBG0965795.1 DUF3937 domain-containing protein [Bacillus sp. SRB1LM]
MNFERCYMFTNKKLIRFGLTLLVCLFVIDFTISYFQTYLESAAGIKWVISETWRTILLDVPESILVILGAIALYDFTKETSPKDASI